MTLQPPPPRSHQQPPYQMSHQQPPYQISHQHPPPSMGHQHPLPSMGSNQPYVTYSPIHKTTSPVPNMLNSWSNKAETKARNIWHNLKTGPSVTEAAWGKLNLTAKAMSEGGFESLFKHHFGTHVNEKLRKTYACSISTTTGPVAGTLYLSTHRVCFSCDLPLSLRDPSGLEKYSYYKVIIPLANIGNVNPSVPNRIPAEQYMQVPTNDGHDFWFMGFVKFEKASHNLLVCLSEYKARQNNHQYIVFSSNGY